MRLIMQWPVCLVYEKRTASIQFWYSALWSKIMVTPLGQQEGKCGHHLQWWRCSLSDGCCGHRLSGPVSPLCRYVKNTSRFDEKKILDYKSKVTHSENARKTRCNTSQRHCATRCKPETKKTGLAGTLVFGQVTETFNTWPTDFAAVAAQNMSYCLE